MKQIQTAFLRHLATIMNIPNQPVVLPGNGKLVFIGESPGDRFTITTDFAENLGAGLNRGEK
ncbi:MAG: hypothetical protein ACOX86_12135 [Pelotomaculaceae bacterium]|nr:hypothetical protein [Peptococcaceae bacterium]